ncbi:hypothetical protein SEA_PUREGLOBE5_123 [Arthrobacter phage Pureglobe5]|nr:hypothetical protein SEA_ODYSSEY395_120 [Arthrobacter phage Odyssey395]UYL87486.1 hypothetical protein SEA_PUREGLOBE5_123 [Arthrobacter phage Pureglobe5]
MVSKQFRKSRARQRSWAIHMRRLEQSRVALDRVYDHADWDKCITAAQDYPPATLIHKGRKPAQTLRHTPWS